MFHLTRMQADIMYLAAHVSPLTWNWVKWTFFLLGVLTWIGVRLRHERILHPTMQLSALGGLIFIFLWGVATRGLFGGAPVRSHTIVFYLVLVVHVTTGLVYLLQAGRMLYWLKSSLSGPNSLGWHRRQGRLATKCLYASVAFALFL